MREDILTNVLDKLANAKEPITSKELAFKLNISEKTVLKYLNILKQELEDKGASIEIKQGAGSYLNITDSETFNSYYQELKNDYDILNNPELRKNYVLMRLLTTSDYINIYEFSDELYISPSLLRGIIKDLKPIVANYNLTYDHSHTHGYRITGDEKDIRRCLSCECKQQDNLAKFLEESTFKSSELSEVKKIILEALEKFGIAISADGINSLALHVLVAVNRIETDNTIELEDSYFVQKLRTSPEYFVASYINRMLSPILNVDLPENELLYLTMHINGKQRISHQEKLQVSVSQEALVFYNKFLRNIYQNSHVDFFEDQELRTSLLNHIVPFLNRVNNNMQINESELLNTRNEFPYAYELALLGMEVLTKNGTYISPVEVSYFALHIALALEKMKVNHITYNFLVITNEYSSLYHIISYKLSKYFDSYINLVKFITKDEVDSFNLEDYQLIINTTSLSFILPREYICISPTINSDDQLTIQNALNSLGSYNHLHTILDKDLFMNLSADFKEDALKKMISNVKTKMKLPDNFYDLVIEREEIESTEFGNHIALPHPLKTNGIPSFVSIAKVEKPVHWNKSEVSLIFLVCIHDDIKASQALYDAISKLIRDEVLMQKLIDTDSFEDFSKVFLNI